MHWLLAMGDYVCTLRKKKETHNGVQSIINISWIPDFLLTLLGPVGQFPCFN